MKKSDLKLLRERNQKAVAPSPKKEDLSDELSKLFDDGTTLEKVSVDDPPPPRPTSAHPGSPRPIPAHPGSPETADAKHQKLSAAPERDFNRRANSLDRDAVPAGLFPGASKKLYDALYLRTRGAHQPTRTLQATRTELMKWAGIGSRNTFLNHMRHFLQVGLLIRHFDIGNNDGAIYEVCIPEEIDLSNLGPPRPTPAQLSSPQLTSDQKVIRPSDQKVIRAEVGQTIENTDTSGFPKTSFKTKEEIFDDDAARRFFESLRRAERELTGKASTSPEKWNELAELLITELKIAAARTTVSNVPAFLTEHLRRRLFKASKEEMQVQGREAAENPVQRPVDASKCPDCGGTGWWYPNGTEKGVAKCRHTNLDVPAADGDV